MTTWVEEPRGGRDRGPRAMLRAWWEVCRRPGRFFRVGVAPGDQAPGLTFAMAVVLVAVTTRVGLDPAAIPAIVGGPSLTGAVLVVVVTTLLVTPALLHLVAAVQTLLLRPLAPERAGISETVQVLAYATAPCILAGLPVPLLRVLVTGYGAVLLIRGLGVVHGLSLGRAALAGAIPAAIVFGYGFRGVAALLALASTGAPG